MLGFGKDGEEPEKVKGLNMLDEEELQGRYRVFGTRKGSEIPKDEKEAGFLNWEFECLREFFPYLPSFCLLPSAFFLST